MGIFPPKVSLRKDEARNNNTTGTASLSFTFARRKLVGNLSAVVLFHDISTRSFSSKKKKKEIFSRMLYHIMRIFNVKWNKLALWNGRI